MTRTLKNILADIDALTEDAKRLEQLGRELVEKRSEIIAAITDTGIRVTAARAMVAKIECTVTLPEGAEAEQSGNGMKFRAEVMFHDRTEVVEGNLATDEMPPIPAAQRRA